LELEAESQFGSFVPGQCPQNVAEAAAEQAAVEAKAEAADPGLECRDRAEVVSSPHNSNPCTFEAAVFGAEKSGVEDLEVFY
jgi:hypothetical protein